jgi:hypothetical protein
VEWSPSPARPFDNWTEIFECLFARAHEFQREFKYCNCVLLIDWGWDGLLSRFVCQCSGLGWVVLSFVFFRYRIPPTPSVRRAVPNEATEDKMIRLFVGIGLAQH